MGKKLYLIGIDAASLWILKKFRKRKGMEIFDKLIEEKRIVDMDSTLPPMTGPAWPSIYTGLSPKDHGVPDFFQMKSSYTPDVVFYDSINCPPFWKVLAKNGKKCLIITPATDTKLPNYKNVDIITGFPLRSKANDSELESLMKKYNFYGEPEDVEKRMLEGKTTLAEATKEYIESIDNRSKIAKHMMEKRDYDFVYVCFTETDRIQHFSLNNPKMESYILPIYASIAKFIGYIMEKAEKEKNPVLIVSDHGAQPIKNKFLINGWLIKEGYLKIKESMLSEMRSKTHENKQTSIRFIIKEKLLKTKLRKIYNALPYGMKRFVYYLFGSVFSKTGSSEYTRLRLFDYDMKVSRAFAAISNLVVATIFINDLRFDSGGVSQSEKKRLKGELISKLREVRDGDGSKLFVNVFDAEKYYKNTKKFIPADIMVEIKEGYTIDCFNFSWDTLYMKPESAKSGDHLRNGIFSFYLKGKKFSYENMKVEDVAPIILSYFKNS